MLAAFMIMHNSMNPHTGSVVARVNKDRAVRSRLLSTVSNMLGRQQQHKDKNKTTLLVGQWNVRTLLDREGTERPERRTALVAMELGKYGIDIAALSETRFSETGSLSETNYTFFWSGKPDGVRREAGVGFAIRNDIVATLTEMPKAVNDRIMTMRIPLTKKGNATLISVYAPTMTNPDETKEAFYNQLRRTLMDTPRADKLILMGDFNARIGQDYEKWPTVMGRHGIGSCNTNGELLLALCSEFELLLTNTVFKQSDHHKTTWMHPRSKHWHLIDYIITRQKDKRDVYSTRAMRGANCCTDHHLLRSKISFSLRPKCRRQAGTIPAKINTECLRVDRQRLNLKQAMDKKMEKWSIKDGTTVDQTWESLSHIVHETARNTMGKPERKHQDWFDPEDSELQLLIQKRNNSHQRVLQTRSTRSTVTAYKEACRHLQVYTRKLKTTWWEEKAEDLQRSADNNDMKSFYTGLKEVWGPQTRSTVHIKSLDGDITFSDNKSVLERWSQHFEALLNQPGDIEPEALDRINQRPIVTELDDVPALEELQRALNSLADGRAPGVDGIPSEIWKHGGAILTNNLLLLIQQAWKEGSVPQEWKDANIVTIFKKGDRTQCGNYRGISLLSIAGKAFARILLNRLNVHITPDVLPETQCGFRNNRSTVDMIFCLRQLQEKCIEHNQPLYIVFVDFTKAFDTVGRRGLWQLLHKYGCPEKFTTMIESLHTGMTARVREAGERSNSFPVSNGVKQGCVLAPTLFSIFLSAMLDEAFRDVGEGVYIQSRQEADLFNASHFKAKTKSKKILVRELLFADDSALVAHTPEQMQHVIDTFSEASKKFGLQINIKKTEVLFKGSAEHQVEKDILVDGSALNRVDDFTYLGSIISNNGRIDSELTKRMAKASSAFGRLRVRLWNNHHVSTRVKCKIYRAIVISTLLYGAESWTLYRSQVKKLHAFMMRHLRAIMRITWQQRVTNKEVLERANLPSMEDLLIRKNLRWTGHILRMSSERMPKQLLFSQLPSGERKRGRPRLRYKDTIKRNLKRRNIDIKSWKAVAGQRAVWRTAVK